MKRQNAPPRLDKGEASPGKKEKNRKKKENQGAKGK